MSKGLVTQQHLTDIADAIRIKNSSSTVYKPSEMAQAINNISTMPIVDKGIIINSFDEYGRAEDVSIVGMTEIPDYYLSGACESLSSWMGSVEGNLHFPDNLTSIGNYAFKNCHYLPLTSLPNSITSIGDYAFSNCDSLILSSLPSGLEIIGGFAFQYCENLELTSLPNGIMVIGRYAFSHCSKLALTSLPDGIIGIGSYAFQSCSKLALTSLPSSITSIDDGAFNGCSSIEEMTLNGNITSIGYTAFKNCSNLKKLILPNVTAVPTLKNQALGNTPIYSNDGHIYVPDTLVDSFKTATNWSDYAELIVGISQLT